MRIFLVVSPPGKLQGRSRSLTHMDALEPGAVFRDSETSHLIVPPLQERRQKLTRSQVSSSEYFSVSFEVGADEGDEFVVASKGTSLAEALHSVCAKRGVELSNVNVYLDSYKTPLPVLTTETSWLGGKHLLIKGKDDRPQPTSQRPKTKVSQVSHSRKSSGYRSRGGRFFSASTEEAAAAGGPDTPDCAKPQKSSKQRWSGLFGNSKDTKMEALVDHLNNYSKHGIPQLVDANEDMEEALYNLEEDWRAIVSGAGALSERVQQQQTAIWELVHTEVAYIHTLKVVTDLFLSCLTNLQAASILCEVDKARLFSNITEIYSSNRLFWSDHLLPMLSTARESRRPLNPQLLLDGFLHFEDIFRAYTKFCADQAQCQQYCREKHAESELFTAYLVWCETQKDCNRLRLMDILVKPMQRITKYSLLLKAIQKHTEADDQRAPIEQMIRKVDLFVNSVNTTLRQKQELDRLRAVISRIEAYDVVESKDEDLERLVRSYNDLDLTCPMPGCCNSQRRQLILEGDLKIKDNVTSKDVHCFLFTDMLVVCKSTGRRGGCEGRCRVLRQPYLVERLVVQELSRETATLAVVYLSEYRVPCGAFLLSSTDTKAIKNWASSIKKAQELYASAKRATATSHSVLALSRQPSSHYYEDEDEATDRGDRDTHSLGLFPLRSPRGSSRASSLNHSHSGSVEMEGGGSSVSVGSAGGGCQSRGVSVETADVRGSSQSSDEGLPSAERGCHSTSPRRKCTSPNTLSIQVPVLSGGLLGQSLPDLAQVSSTGSPLLLVPPRGSPSRGTSYPPPSPPLRRAPALTIGRNPPLFKTRHVASASASTSICQPADVDVPVIAGAEALAGDRQVAGECSTGCSGRQALIKRLTRTDNKRYHTAGVIDEIKRQDGRDCSIHKRLSWHCGGGGGGGGDAMPPHRPLGATPGLSADSVRSSSGVSSTADSVDGDGLRELKEMYHETYSTPPASPISERLTPGPSSLANSRSQLAEIILNDPSLETSDV